MKHYLVTIAMVLLAFSHAPRGAAAQSSVDRFAWLEGDWLRQTNRGEVTESWQRVSEDTMEGVASLTSRDLTHISEHLRIESLGDEVFYVAKPSENPFPTPFKLIEFDETRFVFENPNHDFPERIIYTRNGADSLTVRIEGAMDGEVRGIVFEFEKRK